MSRIGYVRGSTVDQSMRQYDALMHCGLELDGGIAMDVPWAAFISELSHGDEVVVVSKNRLSRDSDEAKARAEMLEIIGVTLKSLSEDDV